MKRQRSFAGPSRPSKKPFNWNPPNPSVLAKKRLLQNPKANYVDLASATYALDTTGSVTLVATIAQGASGSQRIGKKALYKSLQLRGSAFAGTTATVNDCAFLLVYDKRPTGSLPAITDILDSASVRSFNKDDNSGRFKILSRKDFVLTGNSATPSTGGEIINVDMYLKMNELPVVFKSAGTGAIADIEEGAVYLVTVGSVAAGTAAASLYCGIRTRFYDQLG